jgi:hypothetical protein
MKLPAILVVAALIWGCMGDTTNNGMQYNEPVGIFLQGSDSIVINADWSYEHVWVEEDYCFTTVHLNPDSSTVRIHANLPGGVHQAWLMRYYDHDYQVYGSSVYPQGSDFQLPFRGPSDNLVFDTSGTFYVRAIAGDSSIWMSRVIHYRVHSSLPADWPPTTRPERPILDSLEMSDIGPATLWVSVCSGWVGTDSVKIYYWSDRGLSAFTVQPATEYGYGNTWAIPTGHRESGETIRVCAQTWNPHGWSELSDTLSTVTH